MKILLFSKIIISNNDIFVSNNTKISLIVWLWLQQEDQTAQLLSIIISSKDFLEDSQTGWVFMTSCNNYHLNQRPQTARGANQFNSGICWVMGLHLLLFLFFI